MGFAASAVATASLMPRGGMDLLVLIAEGVGLDKQVKFVVASYSAANICVVGAERNSFRAWPMILPALPKTSSALA
jgi:hypothetical protein